MWEGSIIYNPASATAALSTMQAMSTFRCGAEVGAPPRATDMIPARPTLARVSFGVVFMKSASAACANFFGSFDLNQRDLPCVIIFCAVPGG